MDDYMFEDYLKSSKYLPEANSYLEVMNYSDPAYNTSELHTLEDSEILNFLYQRGAFAPARLPDGVLLLSAIRLLLQIDAKQTMTFHPSTISLSHDIYRELVRAFKLSYRWIETSAAVGTLFWHTMDQDDEHSLAQFIYRKSDVVKKSKTRGWEIALSHDVRTSVTRGFYKGTNSSDIKGVVKHIRRCAAQAAHAMLIPMIIFGHDMGQSMENKQREIRHSSRKLENAISLRGDINPEEGFVVNGIVDYDIINQHIIECSTQVMWKNPKSYQVVLDGFKKALTDIWEDMPDDRINRELVKLHKSLQSRISFYNIRLEGIKEYMETTMKRLEVQRHALEMNTSRRESKLNLEIAFQQRQLIHNTKRETEGQKTIATLGVIFLPPTVISGIFSTSFFNFQSDDPDGTRVVSSYFWVFWAITVPITVAIFAVFTLYDWYRQAQDKIEDAKIAQSVDELERKIQKEMRVATIARLDTFKKKEDVSRAESGGPGTGLVGGSVPAKGYYHSAAKEWASGMGEAVANSGRAGAGIMNMLGKRKSNPVLRYPAQEPHEMSGVMGEAMLHAPIELQPSGKVSVHSRSPSRERRPIESSASSKPAPSITVSTTEQVVEERSGTSASDELAKETDGIENAPLPRSPQRRMRQRRSITGGTRSDQSASVHFQSVGGDELATQGVNGRQYGFGWMAGRLRNMRRSSRQEGDDGTEMEKIG